jgi:general secretion pathway protein G
MNRTQGGLTLIEIIVVLAALAILAALLIPTVLSLPEQAEEARAGNDARAIGEAIYHLQKNLAKWPVYSSSIGGLTVPNATLQRLNSAGNAPGISGAPGTADWLIADATTDDLDDHLANNRLRDATQYPTTGEFAWRGSYLAEAPADPWGNRFIVNVRWLQPGASPNVVWVLSAGPNKIIETTFAQPSLAGDDIGFRLR